MLCAWTEDSEDTWSEDWVGKKSHRLTVYSTNMDAVEKAVKVSDQCQACDSIMNSFRAVGKYSLAH